jgi:type IV secretion system protein VirB10
VLLTRGPDVVLQKGSVVEMVLDRTLYYDEKDLDFSTAPQRSATRVIVPAGEDSRTQKRSNWPLPF